MHTEEQCLIKLKALIGECKAVYDINMKNQRLPLPGVMPDLYNINHRIDSMNQLACELEREIL